MAFKAVLMQATSALNTLDQPKARRAPLKRRGRTQLINLFEVVDGKRLADLPLHTRKSPAMKTQVATRWGISGETSAYRVSRLMDIRHPLKDPTNRDDPESGPCGEQHPCSGSADLQSGQTGPAARARRS